MTVIGDWEGEEAWVFRVRYFQALGGIRVEKCHGGSITILYDGFFVEPSGPGSPPEFSLDLGGLPPGTHKIRLCAYTRAEPLPQTWEIECEASVHLRKQWSRALYRNRLAACGAADGRARTPYEFSFEVHVPEAGAAPDFRTFIEKRWG